MRPSRNTIIVVSVATLAMLGLAAVLLFRVPVVQVLGTRVRLPLFHGAATWVTLVVFALMGVCSAAFLVTTAMRSPRLGLYAWESGFRTVGAALWIFTSALGLISALNTWDFTGSKTSPLSVVMQDPRLVATFWVLLALGVLLGLEGVLGKLWHKAVADLGFVLFAGVLIGDVLLDPVKRSLHPDNPVLNSGWDIKGPFFGMVAALFVAAMLVSWLARGFALASAESHVPQETPPS